MYAISVDPPSAATILSGPRPCCHRSWRTEHRGPLLIHTRRVAAKGADVPARGTAVNALVGVVELVDCVACAHRGADPDEVEYHWVLANPRVFVRPLPFVGKLGLFLVGDEVVAAALEETAARARRAGRARARSPGRPGGSHERV